MNKYGDEEVLKYGNPKNWELWPAYKSEYLLDESFPEFTSICPRSGYPDFANIHILYVPKKVVIELKALKLFLNSYRTKRISHENVTNEIFDLLKDTLKPAYLLIEGDFTPRGNLKTIIRREEGLSNVSNDTKHIIDLAINRYNIKYIDY